MLTHPQRLVRAIALVVGLTGSSIALAQDVGLYVTGSLGRSSADIDTAPLSAVGVTSINTDDTDTAWKVNIGYQINRNWGIELGYSDFGEFSLRGVSPLGGNVNANVDVTAWTLALVGTLPLGNSNFALLAKLGVARGDFEGRGTVDGTPVSFDDKSTDVFGGIGMRYNINNKLGVLFEIERYYFDDRAYMYTLGLRYKF